MPYAMPIAETYEISDLYDAAPILDSAAVPAWRAFIAEVNQQFARVSAAVNVIFQAADPYRTYHDMFADVDRGILRIYATSDEQGHPIMSAAENNRFRAVHDYYGHYRAGVGFDQDGEHMAWLRHAETFETLAARQALATETRGQFAGVWVHGEFQVQKAFILPARFVR